MKTQILKTILLLWIIAWAGMIRAQTITTTAESVSGCPGQILVPVTIANGNNIGAISLVLNFNGSVLSWSDYQDLHDSLSSGTLVVNSWGNSVFISWYSVSPVNIGTDTLLTLKFSALPGTSFLNWDTEPGNCEYSDGNGDILAAEFLNGQAEVFYPVTISSQPSGQFIAIGQTAHFYTGASATNLGYQWQSSSDGGNSWFNLYNDGTFSGVYGPDLYIYNTPLSLSGYKFRCRLSGTCTPGVFTNSALLTVYDPMTTVINTSLPVFSSCPGEISVPVSVTNFNSIEAFSLVFSYGSCMTFSGFANLNQSLNTGTFVANQSGGKIYLTWYSTTPVTFGNGNIVDVLFTGTPGNSNLDWDTQTPGNCEYVVSYTTPVDPVFTNGHYSCYHPPVIVANPLNSTIAKGQNTSFCMWATGDWNSYQWQVSMDNGISWSNLWNDGIHNNVYTYCLDINNAPLSLNNNLYRCKVTAYCSPEAYTDSARLIVVPHILTTCHSASGCPGEIIVPVTAYDFNDVGSFSMTLNFNSSVLSYTGYDHLNPALAGDIFLANGVNGKVYLSWYGENAVTLDSDDTLFCLKFNGSAGMSELNWDTQSIGGCEYSDINGIPIYSTWYNGGITVFQPPQILQNPEDITVYTGSNINFSVTVSGHELSYQWQVSTNGGSSWEDLDETPPYSGVHWVLLYITPAEIEENGFLYRCHVSGGCVPDTYSDAALLTVMPSPVSVSIGGVSESCTRNLALPVYVNHCNNVGGISLVLNYDSSKLVYDGYQNLNSALTGGMLVVNNTGTQLRFSWFSLSPANIGFGTLLDYRFKAHDGINTSLYWNLETPGDCEISDISGNVMTTYYANSGVTVVQGALLADAGPDTRIKYGDSARLSGTAVGGYPGYTFQWSPSLGISDTTSPDPMVQPPVNCTYELAVADLYGCIGRDLVNVYYPAISTDTVISITWNSAVSGGDITSDGGGFPSARGVCWSTSPNPTVLNSHTTDGSGVGLFTSGMTGLNPCTNYWVRAYFINDLDTAYGQQRSFLTLPQPVTVSIAASVNPVCQGYPTVVTATTVNGGSVPVYTWYRNSLMVPGVTSSSYTFIPANNDQVYCVVTSNSNCVTGNPATSNTLVFSTLSLLPLPVVSGGTIVCPNTPGHWYGTYTGMTYYTWVVSSGGIITSGGGNSDNYVVVTWITSGAQSVSVNYTNANGCRPLSPGVLNVSVGAPPVPAGPVTGTANVTQGQTGIQYSVSPIAGASEYIWSVPYGATIASGAGTPTILVNFSASAASGNVTVYGSNSCSTGQVSPNFYVTVYEAVPATLNLNNKTINSGQTICYNATQTIYVAGSGTTFTVNQGGSVTLIAGSKIFFYPGTKVKSGGYMRGYITKTNQYCNNIVLPPLAPEKVVAEELPPVTESSGIKIWPNPTTGIFTVALPDWNVQAHAGIEVYNLCGNRIMTETLTGGQQQFSLEDQPAGIYFLKIKTLDKLKTFKIIRE